MSDVLTTFTSDIKRIEADMAKLHRENVKMREDLRNIGKQSKENHEDSRNFISDQIAGIGQMAAGYVSLQSAIGVVKRSYSDWIQVMQKADAQAKTLQQTILKGALATGNIQNANKIQAFTRQAATSGLSSANTAGEVFTQISNNMNLDATIEQPTAMAQEFLKFLPMFDESEISSLSATTGKLHKLYDGKKAPSEVMDSLLAMRQRAGGRWRETQDRDFSKGTYGMVATGIATVDQAMAYGVTAMQNEQEAGTLERLPDNLRRVITVMPREQLYSIRDKAQREKQKQLNKMAPMSPQERYQHMESNDDAAKAFLDADYDNWHQIRKGLKGSQELLAKAAAPGSYAEPLLKEALTQDVVQARKSELQSEATSSSVLSKNEIYAQARKEFVKFAEDMAVKHDPAGPNFLRTMGVGADLDLAKEKNPADAMERIVRDAYDWIPKSDYAPFVEQQRAKIGAQENSLREQNDANTKLLIDKMGELINRLGESLPWGNRAVPAREINVKAAKEPR